MAVVEVVAAVAAVAVVAVAVATDATDVGVATPAFHACGTAADGLRR